MVVMTGAELFTGNTFFLPLAMLEKKANFQQLVKSWVFSYLGNVVGCLLLVTAVTQTGLLAEAAGPGKLSVVKTSLTTGQVSLRTISFSLVAPLQIRENGIPPGGGPAAGGGGGGGVWNAGMPPHMLTFWLEAVGLGKLSVVKTFLTIARIEDS